MKHRSLLTTASLLSILLVTLHLADDIVRGMEKGGLPNLIAVPILVTWLYGTLMLGERRSGYIITLLGAFLGALVPVVHFRVAGGVAGRGIATSSGALLWVWTLIALGVTSAFAFVLATGGLWSELRSRTRRDDV